MADGGRRPRRLRLPMIEFHPQIRLAHVLAISASLVIFLLRLGLCLYRRSPPPGWTSVLALTVDTVALSAALMLFTILPAGMFANGWLRAKLAGVVLYLAGSRLTLSTRLSPRERCVFGVVTMGAYLCTVVIARTHDPLGPFAGMAPAESP